MEISTTNGVEGTANGAEELLSQEDNIKPIVKEVDVPELLWRLYGFTATGIKALPSYDDLNFFFKVTKSENEFHDEIDENGYVLKVLNLLESKKNLIMDGQHAFMKHARDRGINVQYPVVNLQQKDWSLEVIHDTENGTQNGPYIVRVINYLPGTIFFENPKVAGSFYNVGKAMGKFHNAIEGFHHCFYDNYKNLWQTTNVHKLSEFLHAVSDPEDRQLVEEVIAAFKENVTPKLHLLPKKMIHGDINDQNILMREVSGQETTPPGERIHDVVGLIDFTDASYLYTVFDVAICISYMSIECTDRDLQLDVGGHILAGYLEEGTLNDVEIGMLRTSACARLCQSLVLGAFTYLKHPDNHYLLITARKGWDCFRQLWKTPETELMKRWKAVQNSYAQRLGK